MEQVGQWRVRLRPKRSNSEFAILLVVSMLAFLSSLYLLPQKESEILQQRRILRCEGAVREGGGQMPAGASSGEGVSAGYSGPTVVRGPGHQVLVRSMCCRFMNILIQVDQIWQLPSQDCCHFVCGRTGVCSCGPPQAVQLHSSPTRGNRRSVCCPV